MDYHFMRKRCGNSFFPRSNPPVHSPPFALIHPVLDIIINLHSDVFVVRHARNGRCVAMPSRVPVPACPALIAKTQAREIILDRR